MPIVCPQDVVTRLLVWAQARQAHHPVKRRCVPWTASLARSTAADPACVMKATAPRDCLSRPRALVRQWTKTCFLRGLARASSDSSISLETGKQQGDPRPAPGSAPVLPLGTRKGTLTVPPSPQNVGVPSIFMPRRVPVIGNSLSQNVASGLWTHAKHGLFFVLGTNNPQSLDRSSSGTQRNNPVQAPPQAYNSRVGRSRLRPHRLTHWR